MTHHTRGRRLDHGSPYAEALSQTFFVIHLGTSFAKKLSTVALKRSDASTFEI